MTRRTALMASIAILGKMIQLPADEQQIPKGTVVTGHTWKPADTLTINLGGGYGFKSFIFVLGSERVTITADELFAALKADR